MRPTPLIILVTALLLLNRTGASAQCPITELTTGLQGPVSITISKKDNLFVSESGTTQPNSGRISIVTLNGVRRTFLGGLPSGLSAEGGNEPSGPSGLFLRGRTLYLAIGVGDSVLVGPAPGSAKPNPNPSSPLFSSVLAIHFSANVEKTATGFTMTMADQQTLASRKPVTLSNGSGEQIVIELVANFPDYSAEPRPDFPENVRNSNPFDLVAVGSRLYLANGGQNRIFQVELATGAFSVLTSFPPIPNPLFNPNDPSTGGPTVDAVPTGISYADGKLLVALFRGYPFADGTSEVVQVDPQTGGYVPFISGLKTAIDVRPIRLNMDLEQGNVRYLVLQHASGPVLTPPGLLSRFDNPAGPPVVIANCLTLPTSMALHEQTGTLYVTELTGRIVAVPVGSEAYDSDMGLAPAVLNIATRGRVDAGDNVMIAGFIIGAGVGNEDARVVVRAIGPSLSSVGVSGALQDPFLELHDGNGALLVSNDNWKDAQQAELTATGLAPKNDLESAILAKVAPGAYTAIVRGKTSSGIALVEVYALQ
jgi:hypothetical protein